MDHLQHLNNPTKATHIYLNDRDERIVNGRLLKVGVGRVAPAVQEHADVQQVDASWAMSLCGMAARWQLPTWVSLPTPTPTPSQVLKPYNLVGLACPRLSPSYVVAAPGM